MEIIEIVSYYVYEDKRRVDVTFRLTIDSDDEVRNDIVCLDESEEYGYNLIEDDFEILNLLDDENEDDVFDDDFQTIDEELLVEFLNEYYIVYPKKLPKWEVNLNFQFFDLKKTIVIGEKSCKTILLSTKTKNEMSAIQIQKIVSYKRMRKPKFVDLYR